MTIRKSFVIEAREGMLEMYIQRHNPIWPQLRDVLVAHGIQNYSIFHRPGTHQLFGYFEVVDESLFAQLAHHPVCKDWWLHMAEVLVCESADSVKGKEELLVEVFHLTQ